MMACHLAGYPDLFLSLMCNTVEEGDGKNPSEAIHDINGTMFQDNVKVKQLMRYNKTTLHCRENVADNDPISFKHVTNK